METNVFYGRTIFLLKWRIKSLEAWLQLQTWWRKERCCRIQSWLLLFKRRWEKVGVETRIYLHVRVRVSRCLENTIGNAQVFLDFILPEQVNTNVFPHKDKKSDCIKSVFPHIYTRCSKTSTFGMCFHKNIGTRMCILMKTFKWQGNAIVFPALITIVLGNAYVLDMCFFLCFLPPDWNP